MTAVIKWATYLELEVLNKADSEIVIVGILEAHTCFPWEVNPGVSGIQDQSQKHSELDTTHLGYMRVCHKTKPSKINVNLRRILWIFLNNAKVGKIIWSRFKT